MSQQSDLSVDDFVPVVNETFKVEFEGVLSEEMTLIRATEQPRDDAQRSTTPFDLVFSAPASCSLKEGTYKVSNDKCGPYTMYLTLGGDDGASKRYRAIFR
ncbi:hypothetical protein Thimo_3582 [Thioflavicoccus mobilis 8321]|uniref:DUF6916 domain-containing protein n=1 Tax=Thioflavicoccus mobilis 8321 TaxID=765912 RepID=L0GZQ6_9GAMM|nr:hypothetical protein [Thioflavicoccus mobilis]AGA92238.1 hypothetical protein Thimo_3582 [Thioflavicoccus mobilis 8321]